MTAVHGPCRQAAQPLHADDVVVDGRVVDVVVEFPVVDHVAGVECLGCRFPERDAAGRVARQVQHFERPVAQVEFVAFRDGARRRGRADRVVVRIEALEGRGRKDLRLHIAFDHRVHAVRCGQDAGLGGVDQPFVEFVVAAHMVEVAVAGDAEQRLLGHQRHLLLEAQHAHAGIEQQVPVAPADVPHVAAHVGVHVGLPDQGDVVADAPRLEPALCHGQSHGCLSFSLKL